MKPSSNGGDSAVSYGLFRGTTRASRLDTLLGAILGWLHKRVEVGLHALRWPRRVQRAGSKLQDPDDRFYTCTRHEASSSGSLTQDGAYGLHFRVDTRDCCVAQRYFEHRHALPVAALCGLAWLSRTWCALRVNVVGRPAAHHSESFLWHTESCQAARRQYESGRSASRRTRGHIPLRFAQKVKPESLARLHMLFSLPFGLWIRLLSALGYHVRTSPHGARRTIRVPETRITVRSV